MASNNRKTTIEMNTSTERRDEEVMRTLAILDDMPAVKAHHLFRAKLLQRIEEQEAASLRSRSAGARLQPVPALLALLVIMNIASATMLFFHGSTPADSGSLYGDSTGWQGDDYAGPTLSYYDAETQGDHSSSN